MKKYAALAVFAVMLWVEGCASAEPVAPEAPAAAATVTDPTSDEGRYLWNVRSRFFGGPDVYATTATDAELLASADDACQQLPLVGGDFDRVRLVDNEVPGADGTYPQSQVIAIWASRYFCEEHHV